MAFPQYFKGDSEELKFYNSVSPLIDVLSQDHDDFFDECYSCYILGELLYDNNLSPLSNAIDRELFRTSFKSIVDAFVDVGTFEAYISVFEKIFGESVNLTFTIPAAGKLEIDIIASEIELTDFVAREIGEDAYVFSEIETQDEIDTLVFQSIQGFTSQYELEQMLFEMVPAGIYTEITLTLGA